MSYSIYFLYKKLIYNFVYLIAFPLACPLASSLLHCKIDLNNITSSQCNISSTIEPAIICPTKALRHTFASAKFLLFRIPLVFPAVAGGHESCPDAVACVPGCGRIFLQLQPVGYQ